MTEPPYLEPIEYIRAEGGWIVPDHERERWDAAPLRPQPRARDLETRSLEACIDELEGAFYMDALLQARLSNVYELAPARVSSLTTWILERASGLRNPAGVLWKRLGELEHGST